ncbi:LysR family transcriptional regulator [Streptacidiphilus sp. ASG 303]|uniref:helix-turn-helix domain-containing protein n=1 Tax=Streptacidiphilus sp. ASG 303 TaxID=2896847 RepID=UPI00210220FA|nr:LysR family transcriptional regulator [Streptacidiphilus sp. ASG 303]
MELRQLEHLVAAAEEGGFTRAAARAHVSQPGIGAQIKQLERDLGAVLVDRSARTAPAAGTPRGAPGDRTRTTPPYISVLKWSEGTFPAQDPEPRGRASHAGRPCRVRGRTGRAGIPTRGQGT